MSSLRLATAANVRAFQNLSNALASVDAKWAESIDREAFEDEVGRFRVWSGNLGALQKGHSSLDYRLRDSPLLSSNALKFLNELEENLNEAFAITSGARLPYEQQPKPVKGDGKDEDGDEDDGFFSEDEDDDDDGSSEPKTELHMRFMEVIDIIDNLYKLSVRIRTPTIRSRSLKAASYNPKDPETGVDILDTYAEYDRQHIKELLRFLRQPHQSEGSEEDTFLTNRLAAAVTLRRRQFKYWKRHRDKLGTSMVFEEIVKPVQSIMEQPEGPKRIDTLEVLPEIPIVFVEKEAPSHRTGKTLLSGTEATQHHQSLDEIVDTKSVTSYAVTVRDIHGKGVDLPPPPKAATGDKDFECPFCYIICPARYGRGRAWRTHLLQDLQPYVCTYRDCESSEQLFRSRREWAEHEANHRKAWRCPEHSAAVYRTPSGLEGHLRQEHADSFPEDQVMTIVKVGETTTIDERQICPICHAPVDAEELGDFHNHIANHLERIATFALPNATDNDSDGASSAASRGWSDSAGSQAMSDLSLPSETTEENEGKELGNPREAQSVGLVQDDGQDRAFLSAESLHQLPDASQNRLEMFASRVLELDTSDEPQTYYDKSSSEDLLSDGTPAAMQEHFAEREAFRHYFMSLPGAESVRFYRRYGSWNGRTTFADDSAAAEALKLFDFKQFPNVKLRQNQTSREKLTFSTTMDPKATPSRQTTNDSYDRKDTESVSAGEISYDEDAGEGGIAKPSILTIAEIPTLRSLYRSRKLLQRVQSYAPSDSYNWMISFCYHDITKLKVDAIVNSSNSDMKATRFGDTLNHAVHKAAGPGLAAEAKTKPKIKPGQVELTHGHKLPSAWIIHTARTMYSPSKGMGQFNMLTESYRSALKMALNYEFKTIAFPCIGTGGCHFPPRAAARIALQEVREYLDTRADHTFERIVFCVNNALDEKAYMDFFPVFFPPTHGDLDVARSAQFSPNRAALAVQALEARAQVEKLFQELNAEFSLGMPGFEEKILNELIAIDTALAAIRGFLLGPRELNRSLGDLNLFCSVIQTICGSVTEIVELAKDTSDSKLRHKVIWDDFNEHMLSAHGTDLAQLLADCRTFIQLMSNILLSNYPEPDEMADIRRTLENYKAKVVGQETEGFRDHLDEVLYTRQHQREKKSHIREVVRVHQIPSLSRLYQLNELESKPTLAQPSEIFNYTVCLAREDITMLEVDIIVNSTDMSFAGMGTLDRSIFEKGGPDLRETVKKFGVCKEGDVRTTPGFMLPAKNILHVVPPEQHRSTSKDTLRKIYREILHTAVLLRASSIAIPSIGTGMLNYPRRDCASLAMEEVKMFLETAEPTSLLEKIIFVVYSSNDEFIYKSLLPLHFPPKGYIARDAATTHFVELAGDAPPTESPAPGRTLFNSIGDAFRSVRFGKQPEVSRQIHSFEEHALLQFERHAKDCDICQDINKLYLEGRDLCYIGYPLAQTVLWWMNMKQDQKVYSRPSTKTQSVRLEIPGDLFPISLTLLTTVEKSFRDEHRSTPFVSQNRGSTQDQSEVPNALSAPSIKATENSQAQVAIWSNLAKRWDPIFPGECSLHLFPGRVEMRESDSADPDKVPLLAIKLSPTTVIARHLASNELKITNAERLPSVIKSEGDILLRTQNGFESEALLGSLLRAVVHGTEGTDDYVDIKRRRVPSPEITAEQEGSEEQHGETQVPEATYAEWNQRLRDIRADLASRKPRDRPMRPLDLKVQSLSEGASSFLMDTDEVQPSSQPRVTAEVLDLPSVPVYEPTPIAEHDTAQDEVMSPLASEILEHLSADLKTRPGSYIGKHTKDIAAFFEEDETAISAAIEELAAQKKVHKTVDGNTWVISTIPKDLPVLSEGQASSDLPQDPTTSGIEQPMSLLSAQVLAYMRFVHSTPGSNNGQTVRELASALQKHTIHIWPVIRDLATRGHIRQTPNAETWVLTEAPKDSFPSPDAPGQESSPAISTAQPEEPPKHTIHDTAPFNDTPPSPVSTHPPSAIPIVTDPEDLPVLNFHALYSHPAPLGARWTRIDKRLVSAQVLREADEDFDETDDSLVVHRVLRRGEVELWADKTVEWRAREDEGVEGTEGGESRVRGKGKGRRIERRSGARGAGGKEEIGWRDGRGEKDRRQTKLDRVLAGDMREDELGHFRDEEGEM